MAYPNRNAGNLKRHLNNVIFNPQVTYGKMTKDESKYKLNISGINYNDIPELNTVSNGSFQFTTKEDGDEKRQFYLFIKTDMLDKFFEAIPDIVQKMKELGHYTEEAIDPFFDKVKDIIEQTPTSKDKEKNKTNITKTWQDLLQTLTDPNVRSKFLLLQSTHEFADLFKGSNSMLSSNNIRRVLLSDPLATFVTDIPTWKNTFNRVVVDPGQFVIIKRVDNSKISSRIMNQLPEVQKAGGWNKLCATYKHRLDLDPLYGLIKTARKRFNLGQIYYDSKAYDVRNTQLIPGAKDVFLELPGLIDNLKGELNQAAINLKTQEYEDRGEEVPNFNEKKYGISETELTKFKNKLMKMCESKGIQVVDLGNDAETILDCVYKYGLDASGKLNIIKESNKQQFAASLALTIWKEFQFDPKLMQKYARYIPAVHNKDVLMDLAGKIHGVYMQIVSRNSSVNESILNESMTMSIEDIANLILSFQKQTVKESKEKIINLMNRLEKI